jgi:hypothetical protein
MPMQVTPNKSLTALSKSVEISTTAVVRTVAVMVAGPSQLELAEATAAMAAALSSTRDTIRVSGALDGSWRNQFVLSRTAAMAAAVATPRYELEDDAAEGVVFLAASGKPDIVLAHLVSGAGLKRRAALVDELPGAGHLVLQFGQERRVGGEFVAAEAGDALDAGLAGRQQAPAIGQDPIGAPVQLEHVVEVPRVDLRSKPRQFRRGAALWPTKHTSAAL